MSQMQRMMTVRWDCEKNERKNVMKRKVWMKRSDVKWWLVTFRLWRCFYLLLLYFFLSQSHLTSSFAAFDSWPHLMWIAFDSDTCVSDTCVSFGLSLTVLYLNYIYLFCNISRRRLSICNYASSPNLLWCILCMSQ